jgi:hypothetical protein
MFFRLRPPVVARRFFLFVSSSLLVISFFGEIYIHAHAHKQRRSLTPSRLRSQGAFRSFDTNPEDLRASSCCCWAFLTFRIPSLFLVFSFPSPPVRLSLSRARLPPSLSLSCSFASRARFAAPLFCEAGRSSTCAHAGGKTSEEWGSLRRKKRKGGGRTGARSKKKLCLRFVCHRGAARRHMGAGAFFFARAPARGGCYPPLLSGGPTPSCNKRARARVCVKKKTRGGNL